MVVINAPLLVSIDFLWILLPKCHFDVEERNIRLFVTFFKKISIFFLRKFFVLKEVKLRWKPRAKIGLLQKVC